MPAQLFRHPTYIINTMKNTILTISSVVVIAGAANAQTYANVNFAVSGSNLVGSLPDGTTVTISSSDGSAPVLTPYWETQDVAAYTGKYGVTTHLVDGDPNLNTTQDFTVSFSSSTSLDTILIFHDVDRHTLGESAEITSGTATFIEQFGVTVVGGVDSPAIVSGLQVTPSTSPFDSDGNATVFSLSGTTWDINLVRTNPFANNPTTGLGFTIAYEVTPVPEPSSTALLGLGALGLLVRRKR